MDFMVGQSVSNYIYPSCFNQHIIVPQPHFFLMKGGPVFGFFTMENGEEMSYIVGIMSTYGDSSASACGGKGLLDLIPKLISQYG